MTVHAASQLERFGPDRGETMSLPEAQAWCRTLVRSQYENFSVLSSLVPAGKRTDFAAVYAFCRSADDLGDESGSPERAAGLLAWWREELASCYAGAPRHPVFVALAPSVERYDLPQSLFEDLIRAFEQDQRLPRYETWAELEGYCRLSANPVGRLVLAVLEEPTTPEVLAASDAISTGLQLTNHWQDIARDMLERDRIYVPRALIQIDNFESRLRASARQGYAVDQDFLGESRKLVRTLVDRTWPYYERGGVLLERVRPESAKLVWLLAAGGQRVLRLIETWNYETVLHRPKLNRLTKLWLVARARWYRPKRAVT